MTEAAAPTDPAPEPGKVRAIPGCGSAGTVSPGTLLGTRSPTPDLTTGSMVAIESVRAVVQAAKPP